MKPENIFLDDELHAKIGDFGFSRILEHQDMMKFSCGTTCYLAPEILRKMAVDPKKSDMWAVGLIFYSMLFNSLPWPTLEFEAVVSDILNLEIEFPKFVSTSIAAFLHNLLDKDPAQRFTATEAKNVLNEAYFLRFHEFLPEEESAVISSRSSSILPAFDLLVKPNLHKNSSYSGRIHLSKLTNVKKNLSGRTNIERMNRLHKGKHFFI